MDSPSSSSSKSPKQVRFADSTNASYYYDSDGVPSPTSARSPPFPSSTLQHSPSPPSHIYNSRSLNETPSPVYVPITLPPSNDASDVRRTARSLPPIQTGTQPIFPTTIAIQTHGRNDSGSSTTSFSSIPPPTPNLRPIELPSLDGDQGAAVTITDLHRLLLHGHSDLNLACDPNDAERYIASLPLEVATTPGRHTMVLQSRYLPWRVHVFPQDRDFVVTVRDVIIALYSSLRMRVTEEEMVTVKAGSSVRAAFQRRVAGKSEAEQQKGIRRVDFLLKNTRFRGLAATDNANIWKICLEAL